MSHEEVYQMQGMVSKSYMSLYLRSAWGLQDLHPLSQHYYMLHEWQSDGAALFQNQPAYDLVDLD